MRTLQGVIAAALGAFPNGCRNDQTGPFNTIVAKAGSPTARAEMAAEIVAGVQAKRFGIGEAIDAAQQRLRSAGAGSLSASPDAAASRAATAFAGAVLDATPRLEGTLPTGGEHEIFWMQVGRLAFRAGEEAFANQRVAEARSLVFAGGPRRQSEPYWTRYSDHVGLASAILAADGERAEAISRLQSRARISRASPWRSSKDSTADDSRPQVAAAANLTGDAQRPDQQSADDDRDGDRRDPGLHRGRGSGTNPVSRRRIGRPGSVEYRSPWPDEVRRRGPRQSKLGVAEGAEMRGALIEGVH